MVRVLGLLKECKRLWWEFCPTFLKSLAMQWTIESVSPKGSVLANLQSQQGLEATLYFQTPRRSKVKVNGAEYTILDKDGFFRRDVRLIAPDGTVEIAASVGWSGRMWWLQSDDSKVFYDFSADWNQHRVVLQGDTEVMRLLPSYHGKKLTGCEVRGLTEHKFWSIYAFYLMVYDERESLESAKQWSDIGRGAGALSLEVAAEAIFGSG